MRQRGPQRLSAEACLSVISVAIVVEVRVYREGLADALRRRGSFHVVMEERDPTSLLERALELGPVVDFVLLDVARRGSLDAVAPLRRALPSARVVALTVPEAAADVLACAEAGLCGYVTREDSIDQLAAVIESAARGEVICSPSMAGALFERLAALSSEGTAGAAAALTSREAEVAALIDEGLSNKQIAQRLSIALSTVKNHVHNILEKLGVERRSQAAARIRAPVAAGSRRGTSSFSPRISRMN
jgi:two-component system, NarL family, nitrate/nitrite response regulator NarL